MAVEEQRPTCPQGPPPQHSCFPRQGRGGIWGSPPGAAAWPCWPCLSLNHVGHIPPALPSALLGQGVYSSGRILPVTAWFVMMEKWGHSRGVADGMVHPCNRTLSRFKRAPFRRIIFDTRKCPRCKKRLQGTWPLGRTSVHGGSAHGPPGAGSDKRWACLFYF